MHSDVDKVSSPRPHFVPKLVRPISPPLVLPLGLICLQALLEFLEEELFVLHSVRVLISSDSILLSKNLPIDKEKQDRPSFHFVSPSSPLLMALSICKFSCLQPVSLLCLIIVSSTCSIPSQNSFLTHMLLTLMLLLQTRLMQQLILINIACTRRVFRGSCRLQHTSKCLRDLTKAKYLNMISCPSLRFLVPCVEDILHFTTRIATTNACSYRAKEPPNNLLY
jgi:hypothetical protein